MRDLMVNRMHQLLDEGSRHRFAPVLELLFKLEVGIPAEANLTKNQRKIFSAWTAEHYDFDQLSDVQLLYMYDMTNRRYFTQM